MVSFDDSLGDRETQSSALFISCWSCGQFLEVPEHPLLILFCDPWPLVRDTHRNLIAITIKRNCYDSIGW